MTAAFEGLSRGLGCSGLEEQNGGTRGNYKNTLNSIRDALCMLRECGSLLTSSNWCPKHSY